MERLELTTTEAYSLILEAFTQQPRTRLPNCNRIGIFKNEAGNWSGYIHGIAQDLAGFDIPQFISGTLLPEEGEFPALLWINDQVNVRCLLIQWKPKKSYPDEPFTYDYRALIVSIEDKEGLEYARECASKKENRL